MRKTNDLTSDRLSLETVNLRGQAEHGALQDVKVQLPSTAVVERRGDSVSHPLSCAQQRLWFLDQLTPGSCAYSSWQFLKMSGPLNVEALERTLDELVRRHESLRTVFAQSNGKPSQIVLPVTPRKLQIADLGV